MNNLSLRFKEKIDFIDKFLLIFIILIPLALATSIFFADLFSSISGIILLYIICKEKITIFKVIKFEIMLMVTFYVIILISLFFSDYFKISFLASFFYFRYFLVSLSIFYLLNKYDFIFLVLLYSLVLTILIILLDSLIQYSYGSNLFGYDWPNRLNEGGGNLKYITSFFDREKKLGSYLVRFLPITLLAVHLYNTKKKLYLDLFFLLLVGIAVFYTSERTALFIYFIIFISYVLVSKYKLFFIFAIVLLFGILFNFNNNFKNKYIDFTLSQLKDNVHAISACYDQRKRVKGCIIKPPKLNIVRYYSYEHENLAYTSIEIFKENFLFGSGVKTFFHACKDLPQKITLNSRKNLVLCSTHPHNTYLQILSDIGLFGFIISLYLLFYVILTYFKIILHLNKINENHLYYYLINLGILVNILPLVPSGNIFNNWISLIIFYLLGFWLFVKTRINKKFN
jgi:O-antigen ligase